MKGVLFTKSCMELQLPNLLHSQEGSTLSKNTLCQAVCRAPGPREVKDGISREKWRGATW